MDTTTLLLVLFSSIALIVFLIMKVQLHAFISLIVACMFVGFATGMPLEKIGASIEAGMGGTLGFLATVLGLGTILGKMLEVSGGAERIARTLIGVLGKQKASWAMMLVGFITGIPVFFQVGFVLLIPLVFSVAIETGLPLIAIGIPMGVSLITVHCILPPHPAAMAIATSLHADIGKVIIYGLIVGLPAAIVGGPLWVNFIKGKYKLKLPGVYKKTERTPDEELPPFGITLFTIMLPMLIMVSKTIIELSFSKNVSFMPVVQFIGNPITALLLSAFFAYYSLGLRRGLKMKQLLTHTEQCFGPVAAIMLVIGGGGAFNRVLIDSGLGTELAKVLAGLSMSPIILAWIVAVIMRFSVGSATVAMITAVGIVTPVLAQYPSLDPALIALAVGAGAISFSHVNDSGFWIVKEYFDLSVVETLKSYTAATCIASVVALVMTLVLATVI